MARPLLKTTQKKTKRFNALATAEEVDRFNAACERIRLPPPDTVRALANALSDHVEKHGSLALPIRLSGESDR